MYKIYSNLGGPVGVNDVIVIKFEQISYILLIFLLLTLNGGLEAFR